jgi:septal ring factor EnvC (AmiA/AmiB activator)
MTASSLQAALRAGAQGLYVLEAATGLIIAHGTRDLENDLPEDGIARTITENHALQTQVRQLIQDNRRLEERLVGARDTNRFLDKRIADLEAELLAAARGRQEAA